MGISRIKSKIYFTQKINIFLLEIISKYPKGKVFLVNEENVKELCQPLLNNFFIENSIKELTVNAGESNKKIESVLAIWEFLSKNGADRNSLLINFGGGMLTDMAGFAASTFKRGIDFVNIPTTLLSQVDASVGGKTGINFDGLKNEIGTFREPIAVIINVEFLKTINKENLKSGFAEMIKHGLINSPDHLNELKDFNIGDVNFEKIEEIISHSVEIKKYFVEHDPTEKNIRKALNFGHTAGHAFESFAMKQNNPILHGYAVAYGMMIELFLSVKKCGFPESRFEELVQWLIDVYGKYEIGQSDFEYLYKLMTHDKKNENGRINFTLIKEIGICEINQDCSKELIFEALEFYKSL